MHRVILILAALAIPGGAAAQTVTVTSPNTVNPQGQPKTVNDVFIRNPDGTIATVGGTSSSSGGQRPTTTSQSVVPASDSPPFPIGGIYSTPLPTLTNNQRSSLQLDIAGRLIVKIGDVRIARAGFANGFNQFSAFNLFADDGGSGPLNVATTYQDPVTNNGFTARGDTTGAFVVPQPVATASAGVAPTSTTAASAGLVIKTSAGNLYGLNATAAATAGWVMLFNAVAIPADGAVAPLKCIPLAANTGFDLNWRSAPIYFSTGIVAVFSSTGCYNKTGSATAYISGDAK